MKPFSWVCPHCQQRQIVTDHNYHETSSLLQIGASKYRSVGTTIVGIACANSECRDITVNLLVSEGRNVTYGWEPNVDNAIASTQVFPDNLARPQPDYIPLALREDYREACLICDASPKAAATLARRCLQGMIRHFCGIQKGTLDQEIKALKAALADGTADRAVTTESVEAIDNVRAIGNIGAHMEKDIDVIIPVDQGEAQALIELVELLFSEWYIAKYQRQQRLQGVAAIAAEKRALIAASKINPNQGQ